MTSFKTLRKYTICLQPAFPVLLISSSYMYHTLQSSLALSCTSQALWMHFTGTFSCTMCQLRDVHFVVFSCPLLALPPSATGHTTHIIRGPFPHPLHEFPQDSRHWNPRFHLLSRNPQLLLWLVLHHFYYILPWNVGIWEVVFYLQLNDQSFEGWDCILFRWAPQLTQVM